MKGHGSTALKLLRWIPCLFIGTCSWILSSRPTVPMPDFKFSDKAVHLICFAGFAFFTALAFFGLKSKKDGTKFSCPLRIFLPALCISVYGIVDEIHQSFVPGRSCSFFDWCADTLGALIGSAMFFAFTLLISKQRKTGHEKNPEEK